MTAPRHATALAHDFELDRANGTVFANGMLGRRKIAKSSITIRHGSPAQSLVSVRVASGRRRAALIKMANKQTSD